MQAEVSLQEVSVDTLSNMPLWELESFCKEWRVAVIVESGKITEIVDDN